MLAPPLQLSAFEPGPAVFALVHALKYEGLIELAGWLGTYLARAARQGLPQREVVLVPVPLHAQRLRVRGFNQSLLLAAAASRWLAAPVLDALVRRRDTPPLAQLPHAERAACVRDAFVCVLRPPTGVQVVLVDDVVTTGATSRAALAALGVGARCSAVLSLVGCAGESVADL